MKEKNLPSFSPFATEDLSIFDKIGCGLFGGGVTLFMAWGAWRLHKSIREVEKGVEKGWRTLTEKDSDEISP